MVEGAVEVGVVLAVLLCEVALMEASLVLLGLEELIVIFVLVVLVVVFVFCSFFGFVWFFFV